MKTLILRIVAIIKGWFSLLPFVPAPTIKDHRASFLFDDAGTRCMNVLAYQRTEDNVDGIVDRCVRNGDTVLYVLSYNNGDGHGVTSFYKGDVFGAAVDGTKLNIMLKRLRRFRRRGLAIVMWIFADDQGAHLPKKDTAKLCTHAAKVVDLFDKYVSEYVVGVELNEYLNSGQVDEVAKVLRKTGKPVGAHMTSGQYNFSKLPSIDRHYHQYGWGNSASAMRSMTASVIGAVGKPVVACEYNRDSDSSLAHKQGDAAMQGGAIGTGCGRNA
jgi:hypothetical protein